MRHRLDQRQTIFALTDFPLEQHVETLRRSVRRLQPVQKTRQRAVVVGDQLIQPQRQPVKRQLVTGQNQLFGPRKLLEILATFQPLGHGIGQRLSRINP